MADERLEAHQQPAPGWRGSASVFDSLFAPVALFVTTYLAALFILLRFIPYFQWTALVSVAVATCVAVSICDRGQWRLGLFVEPSLAAREALGGVGFAAILIAAAHALVLISTDLRHEAGTGFPAGEFAAVFLPAVLHEELLFRGYAFQRLWRWSKGSAVLIGSAVFALPHGWNAGVTPLALLNIFLGGVVLSLAYGRFERLWFPIGLHLGWNLISGPLLGYEVSGYAPARTLLTVTGDGPALLTGGEFGIEGSVWMTAVEVGAIVILIYGRRIRRPPEGTSDSSVSI